MSSFDPQAYEIAIRRVVEDGETLFRATVSELPDVAVYEKTYRSAYDAAICVIDELRKQALEQGRSFPAPSTVQGDFSGRVTLRMTKTLHRQCAWVSEREGVSLNHLITTVISSYVGSVLGRTGSIGQISPSTLRFHIVSPTAVWVARGPEVSLASIPLAAIEVSKEAPEVFARNVRTQELISVVGTTQPRTVQMNDTNDARLAH